MKRVSELSWESRFVDRLPGDPQAENYTRRVLDVCYSKVNPTPVGNPQLIGWSHRLASDLGILRPDPKDTASVDILSGNLTLPQMKPYAARYGGHQFGNWAGQLGDGRAITLGEVSRFEFQLKGAGPTPYSRRADGRAVLRSSLREFLCSEAMHFLRVPTTRALSLVLTGDPVTRDLFYDGNPQDEPGAIVCRVAPTFLRFGNFQILAAHQEVALLQKLTDFLIQNYFLELDLKNPDVYGLLLDEIARRTAEMVVHWMRVGFVHGVMNTDNMSVLGLTIDYGPYGWLESYDPNWTPNTTDRENRRYRYAAQPAIAFWNLARFAESLFPLIKKEDRIYESLAIYQTTFDASCSKMFAKKLGLRSIDSVENQTLLQDFFDLLQKAETDYTLFFRALSDWPVQGQTGKSDTELFREHFASAFYSFETLSSSLQGDWVSWLRRYSRQVEQDGIQDDLQLQRRLTMNQVNPKYVLRNYLAQNAISTAEKGDFSVLNRLMRVLEHPYDDQPAENDLAAKRPEWARNAPGCSALSCSS